MSKLFEQLTAKRGITEDFLHPRYEKIPDPFLLPDMKKAIERILRAVSSGEKVLIYGDYDVDGVTASTVMEETLKLAGIKEVEIMLPDRFLDGYGMSPKVVKKAEEMGARLVVTVDCGSHNKEIVEELKILGIDTIVTDHHECPEELPDAIAVVNPKRLDYEGFRDLAGAGVAFMVALALAQHKTIPTGQEKWLLDLVLIGTICDSMPLIQTNRILGFYGIKVLEKTRRAGLKELMRLAGVKKINSEAIGFQIGPRLNAAGRIESADVALKLLRAKTNVEAAQCANKLEELNKKRRVEQKAAMTEIEERGVVDEAVIVEVGKWHEGILGIIAGKLMEKYRRPTFALSEVSEGVLKGSGRSFGDFSLAMALDYCRDSIISGGGHMGACGVKLETKKLWEFREKINEYYKSLKLVNQERLLKECEDLNVDQTDGFSLEFLEELSSLEPFGEGNKEPIFKLKNVEIVECRRMGTEGQHLSLLVKGADGKTLKLVAFFAPKEWFKICPCEYCDIMIRILENEWSGIRSVEGRILEIIEN